MINLKKVTATFKQIYWHNYGKAPTVGLEAYIKY